MGIARVGLFTPVVLTDPVGDRSAQFAGTANGTFLTAANPSDLGPNGGNTAICISFWTKPDQVTTDTGRYLISKGTQPIVGANLEYAFRLDAATGAYDWLAWGQVGAFTQIIAANAPVAGQWDHMVVSLQSDNINSTIFLDHYRNGTHLQASSNGFAGVSKPTTGFPVTLGDIFDARTFGSIATYPGRVDKMGFWSRLLTGPEQLTLDNNGQGLPFRSLTPGLLSGLLAWYEFDSRTGSSTWRDSQGNHVATATGTIVSQPGVPN